MTPRHTPALIPSALRRQAQRHRRSALAADIPASFRLSRYWSHVGQARALKALSRAQRTGATTVTGKSLAEAGKKEVVFMYRQKTPRTDCSQAGKSNGSL